MPKKDETTKQQPEAPSINDKITQLDHEIEWFYGENFQLDQAVEKYQAASELATEINRELGELRNQVEVVRDFTKS